MLWRADRTTLISMRAAHALAALALGGGALVAGVAASRSSRGADTPRPAPSPPGGAQGPPSASSASARRLNFETAVQKVLQSEGGYVDHPADKGGIGIGHLGNAGGSEPAWAKKGGIPRWGTTSEPPTRRSPTTRP